jgi:hypothetical protein
MKIITIFIIILISFSISFAASKNRNYNPYWMENDKKLRLMEKSCSKYESMQREYEARDKANKMGLLTDDGKLNIKKDE